MFDLFKDFFTYARGIDPQVARKERMERNKEKRKNVFILSLKSKILIMVFGALYVLLAGSLIIGATGKEDGTLQILKYALLSLIDITACVCLSLKNKKAEIAALILIAAFLVAQYFLIVLL